MKSATKSSALISVESHPSDVFLQIKQSELFLDIPDQLWHDIQRSISIKKGIKGQMLSRPGSERSIFFLLDGRVKSFQLDSEGLERLSSVFFTGEWFEGGIEGGENCRLVADSALVRFACISTSDLMNQVFRNRTLFSNYVNFLEGKLRNIETKYNSWACCEVKGRLMLLLSDIYSRDRRRNTEQKLIDNFLTHEEIAALLFTSRQSVFSALKTLKHEGLINYSRRTIELRWH